MYKLERSGPNTVPLPHLLERMPSLSMFSEAIVSRPVVSIVEKIKRIGNGEVFQRRKNKGEEIIKENFFIV